MITLHILASDFQLLVWKALLNIELGDLTTYGKLAVQLNNPNASRAIGTAIGTNPIAFIIPCHRVIQSTGHTGGYMWNPIRKKAIIAWEAAHIDSIN
jgi:AraC family transcriptional regulator of adaptative response/methylated-DNA-[protein]-cysteine methyltransferase